MLLIEPIILIAKPEVCLVKSIFSIKTIDRITGHVFYFSCKKILNKIAFITNKVVKF